MRLLEKSIVDGVLEIAARIRRWRLLTGPPIVLALRLPKFSTLTATFGALNFGN